MDREIDGVVALEMLTVERVVEVECEIADESGPEGDPAGGLLPAENLQAANQRVSIEQEWSGEGVGIGQHPAGQERRQHERVRGPSRRRRGNVSQERTSLGHVY